MGRIKELIKSFINPVEPEETSFKELALASGVSEKELNALKSTMNGIDWAKFSKEEETHARTNRVISQGSQEQLDSRTTKATKRVEQQKDLGIDRD